MFTRDSISDGDTIDLKCRYRVCIKLSYLSHSMKLSATASTHFLILLQLITLVTKCCVYVIERRGRVVTRWPGSQEVGVRSRLLPKL